jgi:small subunit ribosomal protein S3
VKVWVFKGEILEHDPMASERRATEGDANTGERSDRGGQRRRENA